MENVGQIKSRNKEFQEKFDRGRLLQHIVTADAPVIADVGAHFGESVAYFKKLFPKATIYSFEPDPDSFARLSGAVIEGVSYFNLALSDEDGSASFYRNKISHTNSLLKVNLDSRDSIGVAKAKAENDSRYFEGFNEEVNVATIRLDSFARQHSIGQIDILKIDVQGAERRVLLGGEATLRNTKAIVMEIIFFDYYESRTAFIDVESVLAPLGFRLFSISDISNNPMNGRTDWAEVVYLNQNLVKI
ncbi:MAG: FkbM family methyltransferase [Nitrospinae bacterium]|nr:FkbM family methyltransferase [Nitrospinota bacterium]